MIRLFFDEFIARKGFSSTEDYIEESVKQRIPWIEFSDVNYYKSLFENRYIRIGNCIRTSDRGNIDEFYQVIDEEGNLRGVTEIPAHQGMKGIFSPEEILIGERISDYWTMHYQTLGKNLRLNFNQNS